MINNPKKGRFKRLLLAVMGPLRTRALLAKKIAKTTSHHNGFSFPLATESIKKVLLILPEDRLGVLHHLRNINELCEVFSAAEVLLLCEQSCASLAGMIENATVITYSGADKKLFSETVDLLKKRFQATIDVCCLLNTTDDLVLLYLAGSTLAPIRIGYAGAGDPPFLNIHIKPDENRTYCADWNCAMAEMLGAKKAKKERTSVAKSARAEIDHLLLELQLNAKSGLIGLDLSFFCEKYGREWTILLAKAIAPLITVPAYLFSEQPLSAGDQKFAQFNLPVLAGLSVSQTAALLSRTTLVLTGNSLLFGLSSLLDTPAIGLFRESEIKTYCPTGKKMQRGIAFETLPNSQTVEEVVKVFSEMVALNHT